MFGGYTANAEFELLCGFPVTEDAVFFEGWLRRDVPCLPRHLGQAGYRNAKSLEPSLEQVLTDLKWCEHVVLTTPMWWGGLPAKLKGLLDRTLLPGEAFDPRKMRYGLPEPLLRGRSARVVITSDTPGWWMRLAYKNALLWQLRRQVLGYVGIRPTRITHLSKASHLPAEEANQWLAMLASLGERAA